MKKLAFVFLFIVVFLLLVFPAIPAHADVAWDGPPDSPLGIPWLMIIIVVVLVIVVTAVLILVFKKRKK